MNHFLDLFLFNLILFFIVETDTTFYTPSVKLGELAAFQIRMKSSSGSAWRVWDGGGGIARVELWFKSPVGERCVVVRNRAEDGEEGKRRVRKVDLGEVVLGEGEKGSGEGSVIKEVMADLQWDKGEMVVFCGFIRCLKVGEVEVCSFFLLLLIKLNFGMLGIKSNCDNRRTAEWVGG